MSTIRINGHDGSVVVEVSGYERPEAIYGSDANWLSSTIEVTAGPFYGRYAATLTTHDLAAFGVELEALVAGKQSKAAFTTDEGWLTLEIAIAPRGCGKVNGEALCARGPIAKLSFEFETDQTCLANAMRAVTDTVGVFPIKT